VIVGNPKYNFLRSFQEFNLIFKHIPGHSRIGIEIQEF